MNTREFWRQYKYRLYPTTKQVAFLQSQLGDACELYNAALQERRDAWRVCQKSLNYYDQANQLKAMRADGCLTLVNNSCCQDVLRRIDKHFKAFFARIKRGERPGYPRFRSIQRYNSLTYPSPDHGWKLLGNGKLRIQGAGQIKLKLHRSIDGRIKNLTIKRDCGKWYAIFACEVEVEPLPSTDRSIGIDMGIAAFATLSDGTEIDNPRYFVHGSARLRRANRRLARRNNNSKRRAKAVLLRAKVHQDIRNQRSNFHHLLSRGLVERYGLIAVENLNIQGLLSHAMAKHIHDAGWASFFALLSYKAESAGRLLVKVDPRGTSQICVCGAQVAKIPSNRVHKCSACGLLANRDLVSAQVILQRARIEPSRHNVEDVVSCVPREAITLME